MSQRKQMEGQLNKLLGDSAIYKVAAFLIILGLLVGAYSANQSYAWFTDSHDSDYELVSGKVHYKVDITTDGGFMVPGKNLVTGITLSNLSTIDTDVRMKLEYTVWTSNGGIESATSQMAIYVTNASIAGAAEDQYLELAPPTSGGETVFSQVELANGSDTETWWANTATVPAIAADVPERMPLPFEALSYYGPKTTNLFAGRNVTLKLTLQAKQREHVDWSQITVYEKFTGTGS